jgi:hypothetical protein
MTKGQFTQTPEVPVYTMVQYSGTIEEFAQELDDVVPGDLQVFADQHDATRVFIVHNTQLMMTVQPGWWVGFNFGTWTSNPDSDMHGTVGYGYTPVED